MRSMFNGTGYFCYRGPDGVVEDDFLTCNHCSQGMLKLAWKQRGGMCMVCEAPICINCLGRTAKHGCEGPEVKRLESAVNDAYRREQNAKVLGI